MTRDEAKAIKKDRVIDYMEDSLVYNIYTVNERIDEIYDYFENRSCENCQNYNPSDYDKKEEILDQWLCCHLIYAETRDLINFKDFCCNKWESNK